MNQEKFDPAVSEFIAEGREIVERVSSGLRKIELGGSGGADFASIYRDVHTLKGSSQLFGFKLMGQVSHAIEACLDPVRKGRIQATPLMMRACVRNFDLLDRLLNLIESQGAEACEESEIINSISLLIEASIQADGVGYLASKDSLPVDSAVKISDSEIHHSSGESESTIPITTAKLNNENVDKLHRELSVVGATAAAATASAATGESTVRVQVSLLDRILNLVGELVLVRNQMLQHRNRHNDIEFLNTSKSLDVVTNDLQGEIMKTRMQPIETVVGKFQRVVRDMARDFGKKIDLTIEGSDTELDKSLLEAMKDPLNHIVRNACDHGIELPEERKKNNKPETGHLLLRSFQEGGQVVIEISDDGRGINRKKVLEKVIERGLKTREEALRLTDREVCEIVFTPGFSTASSVTAVSGRGVGMDVVKTNIEKVGGSVEIRSVEGNGTTLQLRIPLTLAIVPALIVRSGSGKFAIPQVKLVELVHAEGLSQDRDGTGKNQDHNKMQIETLQGRPMFRLRGQLLPLYDLREITGEAYDSKYKQGIFIVVLSVESETFGLLVPEVLDTADIVVKPLGAIFNSLNAFSGATILGDGTVALILDVGGVALHGRVLNRRAQKEERETFSKHERAKHSTDVQEYLLFSLGGDTTHALPLCLVNRLEEFAPTEIEKSGELNVVRYREQLLPLINVSEVLQYAEHDSKQFTKIAERTGRVPVVVVQRSGRNFGLVVNEILDVTAIEGQIDDAIRDRSGILGNLIHADEVHVVIDALGIIEEFNIDIRGESKRTGTRERLDSMAEMQDRNRAMKLKTIRVLYAEDVAFFRKHVSKVLSTAGIDVTTVEDGEKALAELVSSEPGRYNLVLSDIEMPNMNGLGLARSIRKLEKYKQVPMIALTTRFREQDMQEGYRAGFDRYLEKLNPEKLLLTIDELMKTENNSGPQNVKTGEQLA